MSTVLLLNASFEPLKVISWQRAVSMFFVGKVEIVEEYEHEIRSVSIAIKAPAVVRLLSYVKIGTRRPPLSRANILARDGFECQYCGTKLTSKIATLDHILPRSRGGKTSWENVVCACGPCNRKKGAKLLSHSGMKLRSDPTQPNWLPILQVKLDGQVPNTWYTFLRPFLKDDSRS